jgi:hypothetical protein
MFIERAPTALEGNMTRLGSLGVAVVLLSLLNIFALAQRRHEARDDYFLRLLRRADARHLRARRNLEAIVRNQPNFLQELQGVAGRLGTDPAWLLNVMAVESLFIPGARNPLPGQTASGLLQIIESTARRLGTTTRAIRKMNPVEQLYLVERYLEPFKGRLNTLADVYMAVFRGSIIEGGDGVVVVDSSKKPRLYRLNSSLDLDVDGVITKGELGLAALSVGRFAPARPLRGTGGVTPSSSVLSESVQSMDLPPRPGAARRKRSLATTRSIYIRRARS